MGFVVLNLGFLCIVIVVRMSLPCINQILGYFEVILSISSNKTERGSFLFDAYINKHVFEYKMKVQIFPTI